MKKYRIKEITSRYTGRRVFIPQRRILFFWVGWDGSEWSILEFDTFHEAELWLKKEEITKTLKPVYHYITKGRSEP